MMEKINLTNYEAFFLDYTEGNLTASQEEELQDFLLKHPALKIELEEFRTITLEEEKVINKNLKNSLKREESTALPLIDYLMIAEVEGTITTKEKAQLSEMVQENPSLMNDLSIYHKVKLTDEKAIIFPKKSALLQKERKAFIWWQYSAAVAAVILFLLFWQGNTEFYYSPRSTSYSEIKEDIDTDNNFAFIVEKEEQTIQNNEPLKTQLAVGKTLTPAPTQKRKIEKEQKEDENKIDEKKPLNQFANNEIEPNVPKPENSSPFTEEDNQYADATSTTVVEKETDKFVPLKEFAKERIKTDVLKGKTFSETIIDELEEASNDKISFKREKSQDGETQKFAINIGKFSLSRNK